ncbi:MAG: uracil phosphoribosyltransferase [Alphaproteobacteria bacterium]|nr:uracil phosphoribosyltransferase [Alphaproteobacteria bacterium]
MRSYPEFPNFFCVDHPLILHKLTQLRDARTGSLGFRTMLREISLLIGYEISRDMHLTMHRIKTPVAEMDAPVLDGPEPCIVPVLRAGLGMADGLLDLMPTAQVGHIGVYRDHETKQPVEYLVRLPKNRGQHFFVTDPMLATGHSLAHACDVLVRHGVLPENIRAMALVAAPEGVRNFMKEHPMIRVYCAALDEKLNEHAYIVPGLGDAGDRMFGTVE